MNFWSPFIPKLGKIKRISDEHLHAAQQADPQAAALPQVHEGQICGEIFSSFLIKNRMISFQKFRSNNEGEMYIESNTDQGQLSAYFSELQNDRIGMICYF